MEDPSLVTMRSKALGMGDPRRAMVNSTKAATDIASSDAMKSAVLAVAVTVKSVTTIITAAIITMSGLVRTRIKEHRIGPRVVLG